MKSLRFSWVDYAKGIAIILVVYRHVFEGIKSAGISVSDYFYLEQANLTFFSFRMPLFFIVSGIFFSKSLSKRGLLKFVETKAKTILYVYLLWASLQIVLQILLHKYVNADRSAIDFLYLLYLPREIDQFWYLHTLFLVTVLYAVVSVKLKPTIYVQIIAGIFLYFLSAYVIEKDIELYFIKDVMHYYLFFSIGELLSKYFLSESFLRKFGSWKFFFILLPIFIFAQYLFLKINIENPTPKSDYVEYYNPLLFLPITLVGCFFVINLSILFQNLNIAHWLKNAGKHSLYIYVAHVFAASASRIFITKVLHIFNVPFLLVAGICLGCIVPILIFKVTKKLNWYWVFSLERYKD